MNRENDSSSWSQLVTNHRADPVLRSRTCHIYNRRSKPPPNDPKRRCPCGRLVGRHSLDRDCLESQTLDRSETWIPLTEFYDNKTHSCQLPVNVFGTLTPRGCKFLRIDNRFDVRNLNELNYLYRLILEDCGGKKPDLILSVCGGAKYFTLTEQLHKKVVRGIIDIAAGVGK